ncbi:MAG: GAF domain-containing protein [Polyangiaceae bacterium]|nr:GAF domain-containing protein [Polyangiaceae bacterium]
MRIEAPDADVIEPSSDVTPSISHATTDIAEVFDFVSFVSKSMPLTALLDGLPARAAKLLRAEVVSLYLLEGHGEGLVLRGNVGFGKHAQGTIRLRVGEGLTGLAVKQLLPVSAVRAAGHQAFRRFEQLDEDRFPVFLAVPILGPDRGPLGALVAQRPSGAFTEQEIVLAAALTAPIAHAVRHAALLDVLRDKPARRSGGGTRKVTLPGRPVTAGRALGAVAALRRPAKDRRISPRLDEEKHLLGAFDAVEKAVGALQRRALALHLVGETSFLASYALMASDSRLRERACELVRQGHAAPEALSTLAREVTRAATGIVGDPFLAERSRDIEDLVDAVLMLASPDARGQVPAKAVLLTEQVTVFDLIVTAKTQPSGIALTQRINPRTEVLLRLLDVPAIAEIDGGYKWASPGDVALLDADHGFLIVNPSRAEVAALRAWRKKTLGSEVEAEPEVEPDSDR